MVHTTKTVVLITGANQGIGFEIAKKLATEQAGYHIILGVRDLSKGAKAASQLQGLRSSVSPILIDVTSDDSIDACMTQIAQEAGKLDVLINNAGIGGDFTPSEPTLRGKFRKVFDTNVFGVAYLTEAALPLLEKAEVPRIVMMTSELGSNGNTLDPEFPYYGLDNVPYKVSKAALNMIGSMYHVKCSPKGFKVNLCCPGLRKTNFTGHMDGAGDPTEGAINASRLAALDKDGPSGTFTNKDGIFPF